MILLPFALLLLVSTCISTALPLSPRQLVLPGAGGTNYWWFPVATASPSSASISSEIPSSPASTSTYASYITSSTFSPTPLSSSSSSTLINNSNTSKPFNTLYLIPVFAVVGLSILIGIIWLIHGCCTRKPKYRTLHPPRPRTYLDIGSQKVSFKALRYEDIPSDIERQCDAFDDDDDDDHHHHSGEGCRHVREYGFECDCQQLGDDGRRDGEHVDEEGEEEEKEDRGRLGDGLFGKPVQKVKLKDELRNKKGTGSVVGTSSAGFRIVDDEVISSSSPLSQLSTRIKHDSSSSSGLVTESKWMDKVISTISRLSSGSSSGKDEEDRYTAIPGHRVGTTSSTRRRQNKLVKKPPAAKQKNRDRKKSSTGVRVVPSSPSSPTRPPRSVNLLPKELITTAYENENEDEVEGEGERDGEGEKGEKEVILQRRLQNHRESIASLPAGMVFSPPSVGFSVFGEEDLPFWGARRDSKGLVLVPKVYRGTSR